VDNNNFFSNLRDVTILTKRECEVASLIAEGWNNKEIAKRLFLSIHTVEHHINTAFTKMQARYDCKGRNLRSYLCLLYRSFKGYGGSLDVRD